MIPKLYKAADVCEMAQVQPYVLRSWEKEFPGIGVQKSADSQRLYRQSDLDQILRIKQLVFGEGLTLAGARRRLEAQLAAAAPLAEADDSDAVLETLGQDARARIARVRAGLRSLLDVLSHQPGEMSMPDVGNGGAGTPAEEEYELRPPPAKTGAAKPARVKARAMASRTKAARVTSTPARRPKTTITKRKRASA
ncbi:MAG TPA: MerR family transcriptional regulator [Vicinamibacterales bacterium]